MKSVVLDTNILVSASRSALGASFAIMQALRARRFVALASVPLMLEYEAVLKRPEHLAACGRTPEMVDTLLDTLCKLMRPVDLIFLWRPQMRDAGDEMVLETALNGNADALVTSNVADFVHAARRFELPVLAPAEFCNVLKIGKHHG